MATQQDFERIVEEKVDRFSDNRIFRLVDSGCIKMHDYHSTLLMIFHQTYESASAFSLAAANCDPRHVVAKSYLMAHAEEEKDHWQWVISDLRTTGYQGKDPRELYPSPECQAYVALNFYVAMRYPLARLAIAIVLETIGARYGKTYATRVCELLSLRAEQAKFFFGHGDTDVGHAADLLRVISETNLGEKDWDMMCHAASTAGTFYTAMYNAAE